MSQRQGVGFMANSMSNLVVGGATLGYAVIVPASVVRLFGTDLYGTWYLAFQLAAYVLLLDLGSQFVVINEASTPLPDSGAARVTTAAMLAQSGLAVVVVGSATAWAGLTGQARLAQLFMILGAAAVASLLATTVKAWFGGLQRAHMPALWLVGARVAGIAGLAVAIATDSGIVALTMAVAVPQLVVHAGLLVWAHRPPSPWARPDRAAFLRLFRSTLPLALWTVCGVLIAGVDIFVVRAVDPSELGMYAIALPLLAVPTGIVTAAIAAWLPRVARAEASRPKGGRESTLTGTTVMTAALSVGAIVFVVHADDIVRLWAGPGQWDSAATYLRLLYLASCLRFVFLPWVILLVARGDQRRITLAPVTEATTNLVASVILGLWLGAIGVALGTLAGAVVASVLYLAWGIPRTAGTGIALSALLGAARDAWLPLAAATGLAFLMLTDSPAFWRNVATTIAVGVQVWWCFDRRSTVLEPVAQLKP